MFLDLDASSGEWFNFFSSHIDQVTGEPVYEEPVKDARVQIRSIAPFIEERMAKRKKAIEHVYNPRHARWNGWVSFLTYHRKSKRLKEMIFGIMRLSHWRTLRTRRRARSLPVPARIN